MKLISDEALEKMLAVIDIYHGDDEEMRPIEKIDLASTMESKYIRADSLWSRIAGSAFFSMEEKLKIRFMIETEPGEDTTKKEENDYVFW